MKINSIENTEHNAKRFFAALVETGITPVFDLDGVCLDARHRQKIWTPDDHEVGLCKYDQIGSLDLGNYRQQSTLDNIMKDKPLPFKVAMDLCNAHDVAYHVATARVVCAHNRTMFARKGIIPSRVFARGGEHDKRRDDHLKETLLRSNFSDRQRAKMILIDDCLANCKAARRIGMLALHVLSAEPVKEKAERQLSMQLDTLDIRPLV